MSRRHLVVLLAAGTMFVPALWLSGTAFGPAQVVPPDPATLTPPRRTIVYRTATRLAIDGRLDEPAWRAAPWSDAFVDIEGASQPAPRYATRQKMLWDDEFFYFAAEMEEPDLWGTLTERDSVIYRDNDFEVFIDPGNDTLDYYELEVNVLGTEWDLRLTKPYRAGGQAIDAWDIAGLEVGIDARGTINQPSDEDDGWTIEIAMPWQVLAEFAPEQRRPRAGEQWRVNFSRVQWQLDVEDGRYVKRVDPTTKEPLPENNWVWSPQGAINMHIPERWGYAQFSDVVAGGSPNPTVLTHFGGEHFDRAQGVAVDDDGFIYFIMNTESAGLPATSPNPKGPFQPRKAGPEVGQIRAQQHVTDAYVGKLSPDGRELIWGTYLGGGHSDRGYAVKVDAEGYVYCSIWTGSEDFPTTEGAYDETYNGKPNQGDGNRSMDLAIVKMEPDGSGLVWSTYLGGVRLDQARNAFDIDAEGNVYLAGLTNSPDFPVTPGTLQPKLASPEDDAFVSKISADGSTLVFSTFLGGVGRESAVSGVRVHSDGTVFVAGMTRSDDFPVTGEALQRAHAGNGGDRQWMGDAFVTRLTADGASMIYSTFLGGSGADAVTANDGLAVTAAGEAVVVVDTTSHDMPMVAGGTPFQSAHKGGGNWPTDGYVARLSADGSTLLAATYLGGTGTEEMSGMDVDEAGNVHISGNTHSTDFPQSAGASHGGEADVFYTVLSADLTRLIFGTLVGGPGVDRGRELVHHPSGFVIIAGDTQSTLSATPGSVQPRWAGSNDALILRFDGRW